MVVDGVACGGVFADDAILAVGFLVAGEGLRHEERLAETVAGEESPAGFFIVAGEKKRLLVELNDRPVVDKINPRGT